MKIHKNRQAAMRNNSNGKTTECNSFLLLYAARAHSRYFTGTLYHLMSRENNGHYIYLNDADRDLFLETLSQMSRRFKVDIFTYASMSNHYHLLVRTNRVNLKRQCNDLTRPIPEDSITET